MQPEGSGVGAVNKGVLSFAQALTDIATQKNIRYPSLIDMAMKILL